MFMSCKLCGGRGTGSQDMYNLQNQPCINLYGDSCGPCREIASLETEIIEAQGALARMFERHRELRGELNRSHSLITRRMPPEIVSLIFQFCLPEELEMKLIPQATVIEVSVPLILGAVCRTWRNIAWSTPKLWNQIYIPIDLMTISRQNELTQQWLSRSGNLTLKICAEYRRTRLGDSDYNSDHEDIVIDMIDNNYHMTIIDTINQYASRWGDIYLNLPTIFLSAIQAKSGAPHLRTVFLKPISDYFLEHDTPAHEIDIWLTREAKPRNVRLDLSLYDEPQLLRLNAFKFNWKSITRLELLYLPTQLCMKFLNQASELTYFVMESFDNNNATVPNSEFIVHPKIRCFKYVSHRIVRFAPLHLPALVEFHCSTIGNQAPMINWLKSTLERSSSLEKLFLKISLTDKGLIDILKMAHSVQHLHLTTSRHGTLMYNSNFGELLERIGATSLPIESDPTKSLSFLPNLQCLTCVFSDTTIPWIHIPTVFGSLSEIDNPLRRPLNSFKVFYTVGTHYRFPVGKAYDIYMNILPKLIELQRAGIDIDIRHQGTNTDMLKAAIEQLDINNSDGT